MPSSCCSWPVFIPQCLLLWNSSAAWVLPFTAQVGFWLSFLNLPLIFVQMLMSFNCPVLHFLSMYSGNKKNLGSYREWWNEKNLMNIGVCFYGLIWKITSVPSNQIFTAVIVWFDIYSLAWFRKPLQGNRGQLIQRKSFLGQFGLTYQIVSI